MPLHLIAKRYFPAVVLVLVSVAAYFQARGATRLLGAALSTGAPSGARAAPSASATVAATKSGRDILERNPFDARAGSLVPADGEVTPSLTAGDPLSWPQCEGVQVLIVSESKDPTWSLATLRETGQTRARLRRVGDDVAGKQVAFIGYNPKRHAPAVWLEGRGTPCQSMLFYEPPPQIVQAAPEPKPVDGPLSLVRSVRVVPEQKDGKTIGLRLFGIRPSSLLDSLGLKNGDRLESINGFSVASPEKALEAYARLRTASRLNVRLSRTGKPVDLNLNIH